MSKENAKKIHLIYGCILSALIVALGIALIVSGLQIYFSDPDGSPYSRQTIANQLKPYSILICVTAAAIVGGFVLNIILPSQRKKPKTHRGAHANVRQPDAKKLFVIRAVLLVVAALFIVIGIVNGSARDVLTKAIKICTECIGLG